MKKYYILQVMLAFSVMALLTQCKKALPELSGTPSVADFDFLQTAASDTLPYTYRVNFTNKSSGEFLYQWSFGDNSSLSSEKSPSHVYKVGATYDVRLTTVGTNGNNSITKKVFVGDACQNDFFKKLTLCNTGEWTWSNDGDAIRVLSPDGTQVYFAGGAAGCQVDDVFKFSADGTFGYDANGQTFDAQAGFSCQNPKPNAGKYKVVVKPNELPQIILDSNVAGGNKPFIGTTDIVDSNKYRVVSYTEDAILLRARIAGSGGVRLEVKLKKKVVLTVAGIRDILTGGSSKGWKLDPAAGANAIIVGTEGNPAQYFGGGGLDPCQLDDVYTFFSDNRVTYNANGATFNGGNIAPNYNCGIDRSFSNISYIYGPTQGGVTGLATLQLPSAPPNVFIGTTDVPAENQYRIIEISPTKLVLRAGNGSGTVFQFKLIPQ
jgi:PKD repeat protein